MKKLRSISIGQRTKIIKDVLDTGDNSIINMSQKHRVSRLLEIHRPIVFGVLGIQDTRKKNTYKEVRRVLIEGGI